MPEKKILTQPLFIAAILTLIVLIITMQGLLLGERTFEPSAFTYTHYNNYVIFKQSFFHLIDHKDLYQLYPEEHWDFFKYSPTFSILFGPLAVLPDSIGLFIWNLLNVILLFFAIWKLPFLSDKKRLFILGFILLELITSIQNEQSNGLIAGLILMGFIFLEKRRNGLAALFIILTIFIKIFGIVALALFLFYPGKLKSFFYCIFWTLLLAVLPLLFLSFPQLSGLYESWFALLKQDHNASLGISVAGWLRSWFGIEAKNLALLIGALLFCLPLLNYKYFKDLKFRIFYLSSILIWVIIFNHKAESATFIIAATGIAIWFFYQKNSLVNICLLALAFLLTILSPTDIFPKSIRNSYVVPYTLKALPCILIWCKITFDLLFYRRENSLPVSIDPIAASKNIFSK